MRGKSTPASFTWASRPPPRMARPCCNSCSLTRLEPAWREVQHFRSSFLGLPFFTLLIPRPDALARDPSRAAQADAGHESESPASRFELFVALLRDLVESSQVRSI